jgi:hypothetical protein
MRVRTVVVNLGNLRTVQSSRRVNPGDLDPGLHLAMAATSAHVLAASEFLNDDLFVPELLDNLAGHASTLDQWCTDGRAVVAGDQEDFREDDLLAARARSPIENKLISRADAILMATVLKNRIHDVEIPYDTGLIEVARFPIDLGTEPAEDRHSVGGMSGGQGIVRC